MGTCVTKRIEFVGPAIAADAMASITKMILFTIDLTGLSTSRSSHSRSPTISGAARTAVIAAKLLVRGDRYCNGNLNCP
jgi:hypothetical protein